MDDNYVMRIDDELSEILRTKEYMNSCEYIIKIPAYKSDGKSVIGYFELEGTSVEVEVTEPEAKQLTQ